MAALEASEVSLVEEEPPLAPAERAAAADAIRSAYMEANPDKVASGGVDDLLRKYKGQEGLLLQRVRYRYGLDSKKGVLHREDGGWAEVEVALRADGCLRWRGAGGAGGALDVRAASVEALLRGDAGRAHAFVIDAKAAGGGGEPRSLVVAASSDAERDAWIAELARARRFFLRLERERACQSEESEAVAAAAAESAKTLEAEEARRRELAEIAAAEEAAAIEASEREFRRLRSHDDDAAAAALEAALDDALKSATEARALEEKRKFRRAHEKYRDAVAAYVAARKAVSQLPRDRRPGRDVLDLVESGSRQCRAAADACLRNGRRKPPPPPPRRPEEPLLDSSRRLPPEVHKEILEADDV